MKSVRSTFAVFALIAAFVAASVAPAPAASSRPACAAVAHGCCRTAAVKACCQTPARHSTPGTPAETRIQVAPLLVATAVPFSGMVSPDVAIAARPHTAPERGGPLDLPTFLSTLLI